MLIPIGTDRARRRRPRVTGTFIVLNMLVYLSALVLEASGGSSLEAFMDKLSLSNAGLKQGHLWQLITYQFAHSPSDLFHLGFNMLFLWIFGSALEDRLGHVNFALFLLMGGAVAGVAHTIDSLSPVIGASGAVCAATGGFLILFPMARIRIVFFFFLIGIYMIPAIWLVAFQILLDLFGWLNPGEPVAYSAHLAGYLYGFLFITGLLLLRIIKSDQQDLLYIIKQRRRRAEYRRVVQESQTATFTQQRDSKALPLLSEPDRDPEETRQRNQVIKLIRTNAFEEAQDRFRRLQIDYPESVLPEAMQLEIANRIQADGDRDTAAVAYERFLKRYPSSRQAPEVRLLLAVLLIRFLNRSQEAIPLLEKATPDLISESHRRLAEKLLDEAGTAKEPSP
ncbi:MAG: hypothetical protein CMJ40_04225 [Phycisphaerae bacterium]|nr:hypothetical protein [Phycisphaerae bacterium]